MSPYIKIKKVIIYMFKKTIAYLMICLQVHYVCLNASAQYMFDDWDKETIYELSYEDSVFSWHKILDGNPVLDTDSLTGDASGTKSLNCHLNATGEIEISGTLDPRAILKFSGDHDVRLKDFSAKRSIIDAGHVLIDGNTSIEEGLITTKQGVDIIGSLETRILHLDSFLANLGGLTLLEGAELHCYGNSFMNQGEIDIKGKSEGFLMDSFCNRGTILGKGIIRLSTITFENRGEIALQEFNLVNTGSFLNHGYFNSQGAQSFMIGGSFMNYQGVVKGGSTSFYVSESMHNYGKIESSYTLKAFTPTLINEGHLKALVYDFECDRLENRGNFRNPTSFIEGGGKVTVLEGFNAGVLGGDSFSLMIGSRKLEKRLQKESSKSSFENRGLLRVQSVTGNGSFTNTGTLYVDGKENGSSNTSFSIAEFLNAQNPSMGPAIVMGNSLTFNHTVKTLINSGGLIEANNLYVNGVSEDGPPFINEKEGVINVTGEFISKRKLHHDGRINAGSLSQLGDLQISMGSDLNVGEFRLEAGVLDNQGDIVANSVEGERSSYKNKGSLVVASDMTSLDSVLVNEGMVDISGRLNLGVKGKAYNRKGGIFLARGGMRSYGFFNGGMAEDEEESANEHRPSKAFLSEDIDLKIITNVTILHFVKANLLQDDFCLRNGNLVVLEDSRVGTLIKSPQVSNLNKIIFRGGLPSKKHPLFIHNKKKGALFFESGTYDLGRVQNDTDIYLGHRDHPVSRALIRTGNFSKEKEDGFPLAIYMETLENNGRISGSTDVFLFYAGFLSGNIAGYSIEYHTDKTLTLLQDLGVFSPKTSLNFHGKTLNIPAGNIQLSYPLMIHLSGDLQLQGSITLPKMGGKILGALIGSNSGSSIFTDDTFELEVGSFKSGQAQFYGEKGLALKVLSGNIDLGLSGQGVSNEASKGPYIASNGKVVIDINTGSLNLFSQVYGKEIHINIPTGRITLSGGQLLSPGDIILQGKYLDLNRVTKTGGGSLGSLVNSLRDIRILDATTVVKSSDLVAKKSIYINDTVAASAQVAFHNQFQVLQDAAFPGTMGRVIAGEQMYANAGKYVQTGFIHAPQITLRLEDLYAARPHDHKGFIPPSGVIQIDVVSFLRERLSGGISESCNGRIVPVFPLKAAYIPTNADLVAFHRLQHMPNITAQNFMLHPALLDLMSPIIMAHFVGRSRDEADASDSLVQYLSGNAREWKAANGDIFRDEHRNQVQKAMLVYKQESGHNYLSANIIAPQHVVNPHQNPGDISGTKLSIETRGDQLYENTVVAALPSSVEAASITCHAEGDLKRVTTKRTDAYWKWSTLIRKDKAASSTQTFVSGGDLSLTSDGKYTEVGTHTLAAGDITYGSTKASGGFSGPLILETDTLRRWKTKNWYGRVSRHRDHRHWHTQMLSTHWAGGDLMPLNMHEQGTQNQAGKSFKPQGSGYKVEPSIRTDKSHTHTESNGLFGGTSSDVHTSTANVQKPSLQVGGDILIPEGTSATFIGTDIKAGRLRNKGENTQFLAGTALDSLDSEQYQTGFFGTKRATHSEGRERLIPTAIDVENIFTDHPIMMESVEIDLARVQVLGTVNETFKKLKAWSKTEEYSTGMGDAGMMVFSLAVGIVTYGAGMNIATASLGLAEGGVAASMCAAGFSTMCTLTSTAFLQSGGDLDVTLQSLFSSEGIRSLAISVASAGLSKALFKCAKVDGNSLTSADYFTRGSIRLGSNMAISSTIGGKSLGESFKNSFLQAVSETVGEAVALKVGMERHPETGGQKIDWITHKSAHALLGAVMGAIQSPEKPGKGALSGAIGAALSEVIAEGVMPTDLEIQTLCEEKIEALKKENEGPFTKEKVKEIRAKAQGQVIAEISQDVQIKAKIGTAFAAALLKQDIAISNAAATNALYNNSLNGFIKALERHFALQEADPVLDTWEDFVEAHPEYGDPYVSGVMDRYADFEVNRYRVIHKHRNGGISPDRLTMGRVYAEAAERFMETYRPEEVLLAETSTLLSVASFATSGVLQSVTQGGRALLRPIVKTPSEPGTYGPRLRLDLEALTSEMPLIRESMPMGGEVLQGALSVERMVVEGPSLGAMTEALAMGGDKRSPLRDRPTMMSIPDVEGPTIISTPIPDVKPTILVTPEVTRGPQVLSTPAWAAEGPSILSTPVYDDSVLSGGRPVGAGQGSDRGFAIYDGPDTRVLENHKYIPAPKTLPAFPEAQKAPYKTFIPNTKGKMRARWKDKSHIYEWDYQHGTVEKYNSTGKKHLGEFDPITGEQTKPSDPSRKVEK